MSLHSRKVCREGDLCQPENYCEAWHCQIHHAAKTLTELAEAIEINPSTLRNFVNPDLPGSQLPPRLHEPLLALTADHRAVVSYLARTHGCVVYALPQGSARATHARIVTEFGEFLQQLGQAEDDGRISGDDATRVEREGAEAIEAIVAAMADIRHRVGGSSRVIAIGGAR